MRARYIFGLFISLILASAISPSLALAERHSLTIVHTNDVHANHLPVEASWRDDRPLVGGVVALDAYVRSVRERFANVLVLDAGDMLTGTPLSNVEASGVEGGALMKLLNDVGYDARTIGNHEFDNGAGNIAGLVKMARHRVLCANLFQADGSLYADAPGHVFAFDGFTVGVVGLITEDLPTLLHGEALKAFTLTPAAQAVRDWVATLDAQPDILIALTHLGIDADRALAQAVPELDIIVGGHTHTRLKSPEREGDTLIVQAGSRLTEAGFLRIDVEDGAVVSFDGHLEPLHARDLNEKRGLARLDKRYADQIEREFGEVIGTLQGDWSRRGNGDSSIGNALCDMMVEDTEASFSFLNGGGIRKGMEAGPVTRGDIAEILPFANHIVLFEFTGAQLLEVLTHNALALSGQARGSLQVGGLRAQYRVIEGGVELVDPTIGGAAIDPDASYTGCSIDYVVLSQGEHYFGFVLDAERIHLSAQPLADFVEAAVRRRPELPYGTDGRLANLSE